MAFRFYTFLSSVILSSCFIATSVVADVFDGKSIVIKDPAFGEVLFDFYQGNYMNATVKLMVAKDLGRVPNHMEDADLLLGGLHLFYGLHWEAESLFNKVIDKGVAPEVRDRAWYYLGKARYQKGLIEESVRALEEVKGSLAKDIQHGVNMQMANLLMAKQEYGQAIELLSELPKDSINRTFARYNLGVALFKGGRKMEGSEQLDMVGRVRTDIPQVKALRDKANIALGYAVLVNGDALKAKGYFIRVRLSGPFSNKALLGLGWANALLEDYSAALTPWMELTKRERTDASVYEAWLAVPYGLEQLKAYAQSLKSYQDAIGVFEDEVVNVDQAIAAVKAGKLWEKLVQQLSESENRMRWAIEDLPDEVSYKYITGLIATHLFQEAIKNLLELRYLRINLNRWANDIPAFEHMLLLRKEAYEKRLPQLMPDEGLYRLANLKDERNLYQEEIDQIVYHNNLKALASTKELEQIDRLNRIKHSLNRIKNQLDPRKYQRFLTKYELLRGLMEWDIGSSIRPRQWKIKRGIRDIDKELEKTTRQGEALNRARNKAPRKFSTTALQIKGYGKKIYRLQGRVDIAYKNQQKVLEHIVLNELGWLKERLAGYLDQARYGMARLQDIGSR